MTQFLVLFMLVMSGTSLAAPQAKSSDPDLKSGNDLSGDLIPIPDHYLDPEEDTELYKDEDHLYDEDEYDVKDEEPYYPEEGIAKSFNKIAN